MAILTDTLIVGAGFSGIGTAIALRDAGFDDFLIVDDADGPGGVWHWNTYPSVAVDIPSFSYQFSFEQESDWSRSYAPGRELKAYAEHCVDKYRLASQMQFSTRVQSATYDEEAATWQVETSRGPITARTLVHAGGPLSQPKSPDIPGLDSFAGVTMHTSRWDHSVDLAGKRVGIIGTGATAVQVIPEIAPITGHLTVFQRTPIWCLPKLDVALPRPLRSAMRLPGVKGALRLASQAYVEVTFPIAAHFHKRVPVAGVAAASARKYMASQVRDPRTREKLLPTYALGCKRPSFHNSYLSTFNRDDVALVTDSIEEITAEGIRTVDGTVHELDVLILATGFKVTDKDALPSYTVLGPGGVDLADHWEATRFHSYQGVSTVGFPNIFAVFGPYGYNGASFFTLVENSAAHIVRVLREARRRGTPVIEVTETAQEEYMSGVLARKDGQVFADPSCGGANSYYFTANGDVPFRASTTIEASWTNRRFPLEHYKFTDAGTVIQAT
ncbi:monoxygenase [Gordonia spumicola]|uniref:Monoxygenase n=1 Tax=Gordonia spumicola TaxID=589161 RepID=A0A7I9V3I2_9ACTN|nr:NAD(P)/FAD-dependent oxidoreductase [Gordonia spumicola]GED99975.1 monoxygenase [Gordonia spumicola]